MAALMYCQDYDETFPRASGYVAPQTIINTTGEWYITLAPYIKNNQVFNCPSVNYTVFYSGGGSSPDLGYGVAYTRNLAFGSSPTSRGLMLAEIPEPAAVVYLMDGQNNYARLRCPNTQGGCTWTAYAWSYNRHNDGANYSFADGHAKWRKINPNTEFADPSFYFHIPYHP